MPKLFKKLGGAWRKGFTLAELLIVVAIIAVLSVTSILVLSTSLEKSREATDIANLRNAKAAATAKYLEDDNNAGTYYYDAEKGTLSASLTGIAPYGKGTAKRGGSETFSLGNNAEYDSSSDANGKIICISFTRAGEFTLSWVTPEGTGNQSAAFDPNSITSCPLCGCDFYADNEGETPYCHECLSAPTECPECHQLSLFDVYGTLMCENPSCHYGEGGGGDACPNCGSYSYDGEYCSDCGYDVWNTICPHCYNEWDGSHCDSCGYYAGGDICPNCSEFYDGSYCANCGYDNMPVIPDLCPNCGEPWNGAECESCHYYSDEDGDDGLHRHAGVLFTGTCSGRTYDAGRIVTTVVFNFNGGTANIGGDNVGGFTAISYGCPDDGVSVTLPATPTWSGHELVGWEYDADVYSNWSDISPILGNSITVYAVWEDISPDEPEPAPPSPPLFPIQD